MSGTSPGVLCLGEPLYELNANVGAGFVPGVGGDVSNVAVSIARQGGNVGIISRLGDDLFGQSLMQAWERDGVDRTHVQVVADEETGIYFVTHDETGHHFTYRRRGSAASGLSKANLPVEALRETEIFYASGISLAVSNTMREAVIEAADIAKRAGNLVAFDPNLRTALWPLDIARSTTHDVMRACDIALPGFDDARQLTGLDKPNDIAAFYHSLGASIVALTLGSEGVLVSDDKTSRHIPVFAVNAIDATGAGDCFNGIFIAHYLRSRDPFQAAEMANIGAALSTTAQGAVASIPTFSDIQKAKENKHDY